MTKPSKYAALEEAGFKVIESTTMMVCQAEDGRIAVMIEPFRAEGEEPQYGVPIFLARMVRRTVRDQCQYLELKFFDPNGEQPQSDVKGGGTVGNILG